MITNFKIFENISLPYKIGDYALIKMQSGGIMYDNLLCEIIDEKNDGADIKIKILNNDKFKSEYMIRKYHILCWSEDKKELETLINSKKYNI